MWVVSDDFLKRFRRPKISVSTVCEFVLDIFGWEMWFCIDGDAAFPVIKLRFLEIFIFKGRSSVRKKWGELEIPENSIVLFREMIVILLHNEQTVPRSNCFDGLDAMCAVMGAFGWNWEFL